MLNNSVSAAALEKSMDALWQKQRLILNNIANEDTPGYKAKRMEFESLLRRELESMTKVSAISRQGTISRINALQPFIYTDTTTSVRADGNNVDIDSENIELARAQIHWDAMQRVVSGRYTTLRYAITGR